MRPRAAFLLLSSLIVGACGDEPALAPMDAAIRPDAMDARVDTMDARVDAMDARMDNPFEGYDWDAGELPALDWHLPGCTVQHGTLVRDVVGDAVPLQLGLRSIALRDELLVIAWAGGFATIRDGVEEVTFTPPPGMQGPLAVTTDGTRVSSLTHTPLASAHVSGSPEHRQFTLATTTDGSTSSTSLTSFEASDTRLLFDLDLSQRQGGWVHFATFEDGSFDVFAPSAPRGGPLGWTAWPVRVRLEPNGELRGEPQWFVATGEPAWTTPMEFERPVPQLFLTNDGAAFAVLLWPAYAQKFEVVRRNHLTGVLTTRMIEADTFWDLSTEGVAAVLDGDALVLVWTGGLRDCCAVELTAELSADDLSVRREPTEIAQSFTFSAGRVLLAHPGGGVDIIRHGETTPGYRYGEFLADNPLVIDLGLSRPLADSQGAPLRLGAGAEAVDAIATRDGRRVAIAWQERGPFKVYGGVGVQGLYYAVLDCDE